MTYAKKTLSEIKLIHGDFGNFIKGQKLDKRKEKKYKAPPYKDLAASNEIDGEPLDEKCWPGYEKKGMKTMFGKRYPNCVKKKKTRKEEFSDWRSELENIQEIELPKFPKKEIDKAGGASKSFNKQPKSRMSALDKNVFSKIYNKAGTTKVTDYTMVPDKFRTGKNFERMGGVKGFLNRRLSTKPTKINKPVMSVGNFASKNMRGFTKSSIAKGGLISKVGKVGVNVLKNLGPKGRLAAAAITGLALGAKPIANKLKEIGKKRRDAAIDKQVDKYVADRKIPGGPKKVNYKPTNQYTVTRDSKGKVTGTGKLIRVVPGTEFKEATMTPAQKRKDTLLKKKYEKSDDMMDSFKDQYGEKKGKEVFYAFIRKKSMEEENIQEILDKKDVPHVKKLVKKLRDGSKTHAKQADNLEKAMNEDMSDKDFKKFNKDMHDTANAGGGASQETQNKYALELARRRRINKDNTVSTLTNKELKNEETAIESELVIQDWNKDDIKFTEIETVDIIKPKPLKESMSNWREELGEDWQKVNRKDKTDGLSREAVKAYRRENPGSKLQTAVTKDPKKLKKGSKSAKRRLSFCRRMKGMKKKLTSAKTRRDPDSRINKALRRWNC